MRRVPPGPASHCLTCWRVAMGDGPRRPSYSAFPVGLGGFVACAIGGPGAKAAAAETVSSTPTER
jgi:hypothetical protein